MKKLCFALLSICLSVLVAVSCAKPATSSSAAGASSGSSSDSNSGSSARSAGTPSQTGTGTTSKSTEPSKASASKPSTGGSQNSLGPAEYSFNNVTVTPVEDTKVILNNPDMGWMIYENYCVARNQSTIPNSAGDMKDYLYPGVEYVAVMFTWADVEKSEGVYDWTDVDRAYDYWKSKGKKLMLRMSTESLLWYGSMGKGIPDYLYDRIPANQKQTLTTMQGDPPQQYTYRGVDFRNKDYQARLRAFLKEVNAHYGKSRPVEYIDLAGYGLWGEWHSGYIYPGQIKGNAGPGDLTAKREGLMAVLDIWSEAFPNNWLSLSYSYDPDSPSSFYRNPSFLTNYEHWSAFDYALTKPNITWRRNGAGGAVQPTDRVFGEKAFRLSKGPFAVEAAQGYNPATVDQLIEDELSLHPNYMNVPGWCWREARSFIEDRPDLMEKGMLNMGYRLVLTRVTVPDTISRGRTMEVSAAFVNRAVGKAAKDYSLRIVLSEPGSGNIVSAFNLSSVPTSEYVKGEIYPIVKVSGKVPTSVKPGKYDMTVALYDKERGVYVGMAVQGNGAPKGTGGVRVGQVTVL